MHDAMWKCAFAALLAIGVVSDYTVGHADSGIGKPVVVKTNEEHVVFKEAHHRSLEHHIYKDTYHTSYLSHPITLMKGEAWFTLPDVTKLPMPNPGVPYAIIGMAYDIVDENNNSVPLTELYMHHWLVYDTPTTGSGFDIGCGGTGKFVSNVYGAGAEMRGMDYKYLDGYGYVSKTGEQWWSANLHFINTEDLSTANFSGSHGAAMKSCAECEYQKGKAPFCVPHLDSTAIFACCVADARCPVNNPKDKSKKKYFLQSNITWTTDVEKIKPVRVAVIDGVPCNVVTNLYPGKKHKGMECGDKFCKTVVTRQMPFAGTIMWAYDHQHLGAVNASLSVNGVHHCSSFPRHGRDPHNKPGDELGYLVGFDTCIDADHPDTFIHVNKGDNMTLTAFYSIDPLDNSSFPFPGGNHTGIMNLFYFQMSEDTPAATYVCKNDACTPGAGGVPLSVCKAACGQAGDGGVFV